MKQSFEEKSFCNKENNSKPTPDNVIHHIGAKEMSASP